MARQLPPVRRVITAIDRDGKSCFSEDGPAKVHANPARPGMQASNVWATGPLPCPFDDPDHSEEVKGIMPPPGGSVLHVIDYPPEPGDPAQREKALAAMRERVAKAGTHPEPGVVRHPEGPHPGMHETATIDYAIVLAGEIWAIMDRGEKLLKAGDVLMQRGTSHAWSNRSEEPCRVAFVLVHATPLRR
ncbi:MAG: cupin domain-containing protein [Burkholderiales bacterium]|nr:cupin domain-containing protein [Burkholderiales bacterium]